jgi:hypothetical protein
VTTLQRGEQHNDMAHWEQNAAQENEVALVYWLLKRHDISLGFVEFIWEHFFRED